MKKKKNSHKKKKTYGGFVVQDEFFHKAKAEWYRARSAYKLIEIDDKFHIIKPDMKILDMACAPGSFLQVLQRRTKHTGIIVGMDIQKVQPIGGNVHIFQQDVFELEGVMEKLQSVEIGNKVDLITSDIAPKTTGVKDVDQYRSVELNLAILDIAKQILRKRGNMVLKVFIGEDLNDLLGPLKKHFQTVKRFKPSACRARSFEEYIICLKKK